VGTGGQPALDGAVGTGGSTGTAGATGAGGAVGTGGAGTGGAGTGGATGTGGTTAIDAGTATDVTPGDDALDVPLPTPDSPLAEDSAEPDTSVPVVVEDAGIDLGVDLGEDTVAIGLDVGIDVEEPDAPVVADAAESEALAVDATSNPIACDSVHMLSLGEAVLNGSTTTGEFNTTGNFCFATCDDIQGWGGSSLDGRTLLLINKQSVAVPSGNGAMPLPTPKLFNDYTVFQINGGTHSYASIYWWGNGHECDAPQDGFGLE
jgi:hypothetical protein